MNQTVENKQFILEFEKFVLDPNERILLADGKPIHLTDKVFDTLLLLIQHNGRLVTKDEMMSSIWDKSFVEEGNLAKNISRLRKILNVNGLSLIETLPRRGYRFAADVKEIDGDTSLLVRRNLRVKITQTDLEENGNKNEAEKIKQIDRVAPKSRRSRLPFAVAAVLLLAICSGLGFYFWKSKQKVAREEAGIIRLTDDPADDFWPRWTQDGRIRFFRMGKDKVGKNIIMNADGTGQSEFEVSHPRNYFNFSPDGTKAIFSKPGDKTTIYLANADGSNEIVLPQIGNTDWSADGKKIVYQLGIGEPKNHELFVYSLETGKTENITNHPGFDADPNFSPDGSQVVFASTRDGNAEIYLMNLDGNNVRRLTNSPTWDNHPVFSPDGTTIAFNSEENENPGVYLMNIDGGDIRRLTDWKSNETVEPGCWSPDGTKIAFYSDREGNDDIYVTSAEVYKPRLVLSDDEKDLQFPSYSPDGRQIVFQSITPLPDKTGELRIYDIDSKRTSVLIKTENADLGPVFSPDGSQIAFSNKLETNTEICLINTVGSGLTNLTQNAARDMHPSFSPDGKQIAFTTNRDGNSNIYHLYVMKSDGTDQRRIDVKEGLIFSPFWSIDGREIIFTRDPDGTGHFHVISINTDKPEIEKQLTSRRRLNGQPVLSPDGRRIAFVSDADGNLEIYLMNANGTGVFRLTRNAADDSSPHWSPNGNRLIFNSNRHGKYALYEIDVDQ